jgi:hypothetical protein
MPWLLLIILSAFVFPGPASAQSIAGAPANPADITVTANPASLTVVANATNTSTVSVIVVDADNNPLGGENITFSLSGGGSFSAYSGVTAGDGTLSVTYTSPNWGGWATVTATAGNGVSGSTTIGLTGELFTPPTTSLDVELYSDLSGFLLTYGNDWESVRGAASAETIDTSDDMLAVGYASPYSGTTSIYPVGLARGYVEFDLYLYEGTPTEAYLVFPGPAAVLGSANGVSADLLLGTWTSPLSSSDWNAFTGTSLSYINPWPATNEFEQISIDPSLIQSCLGGKLSFALLYHNDYTDTDPGSSAEVASFSDSFSEKAYLTVSGITQIPGRESTTTTSTTSTSTTTTISGTTSTTLGNSGSSSAGTGQCFISTAVRRQLFFPSENN